jgi:hypothetical protein
MKMFHDVEFSSVASYWRCLTFCSIEAFRLEKFNLYVGRKATGYLSLLIKEKTNPVLINF